MIVTNSPDISLLQVKVTFDISGTTPQILLENESVGSNLAGLTWWFVAKSPTTTFIHDGNSTTPDITGAWTSHTLSDPWPRPFNQIEWSGAPYTLQVFVKDSNGREIAGDVQLDYICRPQGNTDASKNTYGRGDVQLDIKCADARLYFRDQTNTSYKGLTGTIGASVLRVLYPIDDTNNIPAPFVADQFSSALVPISYSSDSYQFVYSSIWDYDMGGGVHTRIGYQQKTRFSVFCNVDLMPLVCEIEKLSASIANGSCGDVQAAQAQMNLITPKLFLCWIGLSQPLTGVDVPKVIEEIKAIGGFTCDCCNPSTGILPNTGSIIDNYNFDVQGIGGDVDGSVSITGNNISFLLHDVSYVVQVSQNSPAQTTAFNFSPSISSDGYTKTYTLYVDAAQFALDLADIIANNISILNVWSQLFPGSAGGSVIVDGGCIFQSQQVCDYSFTLTNVPDARPYALLTTVQTAVFQTHPNFLFYMGNLPDLEAYFDTLNIGDVTVSSPAANTIVIDIANSPNEVYGVFYKLGTLTYQATLAKNCNSFVQLTINDFAQQIINYLCTLSDAKVQTSTPYTLCYLDPVSGNVATQVYPAGTALSTIVAGLVSSGCSALSLARNAQAPDCTTIRALFPDSTVAMSPTDYLYASVSGACARKSPLEAFKAMLTAGLNDPDVRALVCQYIAACGAGQPCPIFNFDLVVTSYTTACVPIVGLNITIS